MPHPFGNDVELRSRIITYLGEQTLPRIVALTSPLFAPNDRRQPDLVGSGIVLQIGGARLLLTATHVSERHAGLSLNVGDELILVRGESLVIHTLDSVAGSDEDEIDVLVVRLDAELADRIRSEHVAQLSDIDFSIPEIGRDPFLLVGYPCSRNRDGLVGDEFTARAYPLLMHDGDTPLYAALNADTDSQLVLPFEKKDIWTITGQVSAPDLNGISGGGLWRVPVHDESRIGDTRLAALGIECQAKGRHRHIRATRIRTVLTAVFNSFPDLRPALTAAMPGAE